MSTFQGQREDPTPSEITRVAVPAIQEGTSSRFNCFRGIRLFNRSVVPASEPEVPESTVVPVEPEVATALPEVPEPTVASVEPEVATALPEVPQQNLSNWNSKGNVQEARSNIKDAMHHAHRCLLLWECKLTHLPLEIWDLKNITFLNLGDNLLTYLPRGIGKMKQLEYIRLTHNRLTSLPTEIGLLTSLKALELWNNKIKSLPKEIWELKKLERLDLTENLVTSLPKEIVQLQSLKELLIWHNQITSLPTEIGQLTTLTNLYLRKNKFTSLPSEIGNLTALTELDLENINVSSLPKEIWRLTRLKELNLGEIKLTSLPTEIGQLTALTILKLHGNAFSSLPSEIGNLTALKELNLEECMLKSLPTEIGYLTSLKELNLEKGELKSLPTEIGCLTSLKDLRLTKNKLTSLPTEIGQLTALTYFMLYSNPFASLPTEIGHLTGLKKLNFKEAELTSLPTQIGCLTSLVDLVFTKNKLTSLPTEIGRLTHLKYLILNSNQLAFLPQEIGNLTNIERLCLNENPDLRELPMSLGQIPGLTDIEYDNPSLVRAILNQCRMMRDAEAETVIPARLSKWIAIAKSDARLDYISLSANQKITLNEWLLRLEKTRDFARSQSALASIVCRILADVFKNREFKELFFSQAESNNECCEDRAAMALNEIYTSWSILCQSGDQLKVMTGAAKTLCLRKELQNLIDKREKKNGYAERESVEIFLYYESTLKDRLHLVTAIEKMTYRSIGNRVWIDEEALVNAVNCGFFDHLMALPVFERLVKTVLQEEWNQIERKAEKDLADLGSRPAGDEFSDAVLAWSHKQGEVMQNRQRAWSECVRKWYEKQITNDL